MSAPGTQYERKVCDSCGESRMLQKCMTLCAQRRQIETIDLDIQTMCLNGLLKNREAKQ